MKVMAIAPLKALRAQQRVGEVNEQTDGDDDRKHVIEAHDDLLKPFARVSVGDGDGEQAEARGQHDDVHHEDCSCGSAKGAVI
jgi:hypothetical protein